jgi:uncharacterized protein (TIGR01777 family)
MRMTVGVTGAGGFVGRALVAALLGEGAEVVALSRDPSRLPFPPTVERRRFDPNDPSPQPLAFEGVDAVIHLAGESVAGRWNARKKRAIRDSRVTGTRNLVASLAALERRPSTLLSASAIGLYGMRGDEVLTETSPAGTDFLARVCADWERAATDATALGVRVTCMRTGIVLGDGGALQAMSVPFKLGVGGPLGSGRQFVPWIHLDDLVALYLFALRERMDGPINAVTPDYATSARFSQALGAAVGRPALLPAPAFALKVMFGEFASSLLASQLVIPARAEDAGFIWHHDLLEEAIAEALHAPLTSGSCVERFEASQTVKANADDVYAFFSDPNNLARLTPPTLGFTIAASPQALERGSRISYRMRVHGIPLRWETLISRWRPPLGFVDVQLRGPYAFWRHEHTFRPVADGVDILDRVRYALPFGPLGRLMLPFIRRDVESIFAFRRDAIAAVFSR